MLLSIDMEKVKKQLAERTPTFTITSNNSEIQQELPSIPEPIHISGTVTAIPPEIERARSRLQFLRQRLRDVTPDDLDREMKEIRGR